MKSFRKLPVIAATAGLLVAAATTWAAALEADPFAADPGFNSGQFVTDVFTGGFNRSYRGFRAANLSTHSNDDIVVAGLVPAVVGNATGNLGLSRYQADGSPGVWPDAQPPYGQTGNRYVIYPNDIATTYTAVLATRVYLDRIFVLVDREFSANDSDVHVLVFSDTGQFLSDTRAFGASADERGAGLEVWGAGTDVVRVGVVATRTVSGVSQPQFRRYLLQPNGSLNADGLVQTYTTFPCDIKSCTATATTYAPFAERIYIGGSVRQTGDDFDYFALAIDKQGAVDPFFATSGLRLVAFDQPFSNLRDWLTGIHVLEREVSGFLTQQIVLVGEVAQRCRTGIGVVKLGTGGLLATSFGIDGKTIIGGSDAAPGLDCNLSAAEFARSVLVRDRRIQVGGFTVFQPLCPIGETCEATVDARLTSLDPVNGALGDLRAFAFPVGWPRERFGAFWDLVPDRLDENKVTAIGDTRFPLTAQPGVVAGKMQYATLRLRSDRIFGDGFQTF